MPRWAIVAGTVVVILLVASQFLVPAFAENAIEGRLTENGGNAEVELSAFPALRLAFSDGSRVAIEASDLDLGLDEDLDVLDRLDGFDEVAISLDDSKAGPFTLETFDLSRDAPGPYSVSSAGTTSAAELADYGTETLALPGGALTDAALQALFGDNETAIPVELDLRFEWAGGDLDVVDGDATIAGLPAGPIAEVIVSAIAAQL